MSIVDAAAWTLSSEPSASRRRTSALIVRGRPRASGTFAALMEYWDRPPAWFGGIPSTDLQPAIGDALTRGMRQALLAESPSTEDALRGALRGARTSLRALSEPNESLFAGAGAEVVVAAVEQGAATVAWIGTVRAYLVREGRCVQLTTDHSLREDCRRAGEPEERIARAPQDVVTSVLQATADGAARVDATSVEWPGRATLVLTSTAVRSGVDLADLAAQIDAASSAHDIATSIAAQTAPRVAGKSFGVVVLR